MHQTDPLDFTGSREFLEVSQMPSPHSDVPLQKGMACAGACVFAKRERGCESSFLVGVSGMSWGKQCQHVSIEEPWSICIT